MIFDSQGGVCLKKHYSYSTYIKTGIGDFCSSELKLINENLITGSYILPYKNKNTNFSMDIYDAESCLNLGPDVPIKEWLYGYINSIVTTGYTDGYNNSPIENRVVYDQITDSYYLIQQTENLHICGIDDTEKWAIYDTTNNQIWDETNDFYYEELDSCGKLTGRSIVALKSINENSPTRYTLKYIEKC